MAVVKMDVISISGNMSSLSDVTVICGKSGVFQPDNSLSFYSDTSKFSVLHEENPYFEPLQKLESAAASLKKALLPIKEESTRSEEEARDYVNRFVTRLGEKSELCSKAKDHIAALDAQIEQVSHFVGEDLDLDEIGKCEFIHVRFGSIPKESYLKINSYDRNPYIIFFPCSSDASRYWGVYFAPVESAQEVDRIFASLYFERTKLAELTGTPEKAVENFTAQRDAEKEKLAIYEKEIEEFWEEESDVCSHIYAWLLERSACFEIRKNAARYEEDFILTGWVPADQSTSLLASLNELKGVTATAEKAENELSHSPPVKLKNPKLFSFFEFFIDLYGLPSYDEFDPTVFVSITYILLFGIMFGDLGQGLCLSIIGYLMWKLKKMPLGKILIPCGISAAVFGTVFGSCFGFEHWLDPLYRAVLGLPQKPIDVMEPAATNMIIYTAVGIGIFLILIAMLINIIFSLKRRHYEDALFGPNGLAGFVFYSALILGFGLQLITGQQIVTLPYVICLIILPLVVIFFREVLGGLMEHRPDAVPKKWGEFIVQNFFELFEFMLSYAGNTISFLRVGAFVLVHAGMMIVVFTLAEMSSGIGYILIVAIGNVFVMALEGLLVGIQVLRLEFYEMFSRFFEGGGRPFVPVKTKTN